MKKLLVLSFILFAAISSSYAESYELTTDPLGDSQDLNYSFTFASTTYVHLHYNFITLGEGYGEDPFGEVSINDLTPSLSWLDGVKYFYCYCPTFPQPLINNMPNIYGGTSPSGDFYMYAAAGVPYSLGLYCPGGYATATISW